LYKEQVKSAEEVSPPISTFFHSLVTSIKSIYLTLNHKLVSTMAIQSLLLGVVALAGSAIAAPAAAIKTATPTPTLTNAQVHAPAITADVAAGVVDKRAAACTFSGSNGYASASKSQAACATIVLKNVAVPSGTTLDLSKLKKNTHVIFEGTTTWGYKEWAGPRK
jgi:hypothetical protein